MHTGFLRLFYIKTPHGNQALYLIIYQTAMPWSHILFTLQLQKEKEKGTPAFVSEGKAGKRVGRGVRTRAATAVDPPSVFLRERCAIAKTKVRRAGTGKLLTFSSNLESSPHGPASNCRELLARLHTGDQRKEQRTLTHSESRKRVRSELYQPCYGERWPS